MLQAVERERAFAYQSYVLQDEAEIGALIASTADGGPNPSTAAAFKRLYLEFGVESSPRALLDPRAWASILRGIIHSFVSIVRAKQPVPSLTPHGGRFGLPADFLIAPDGRVLARKYANHADDHWSVDRVLTLAREAAPQGNAVPSSHRPAAELR